MEYITFDELMIFGLQLTNYNKFDNIVEKIKIFRKERKTTTKSYNKFMREYQKEELKIVFQEEIKTGHTRTRESRDISIKKFIKRMSGIHIAIPVFSKGYRPKQGKVAP